MPVPSCEEETAFALAAGLLQFCQPTAELIAKHEQARGIRAQQLVELFDGRVGRYEAPLYRLLRPLARSFRRSAALLFRLLVLFLPHLCVQLVQRGLFLVFGERLAVL